MHPPAIKPSGIQAVIFDVYGTLLHVEDGAGGEAAWRTLISVSSLRPEVSLEQFGKACRWHTAMDHTAAKLAGELYPEVDWADISLRSFPGLSRLSKKELDEFLQAHAGIVRHCSPMPGALEFLSRCRRAGLITGIASNAQPCTRGELHVTGFSLELFDHVFLSGDHGFAKPSPRVFAVLTTALAARKVTPASTLLVGDRADNDIAPAMAAGWQTWHFAREPGRDFPSLTRLLFPRED